MVEKLYKYEVNCLTENIGVNTGYRDTPPTHCPNNNTHVIDDYKIIDSVYKRVIRINQEPQIITGNNYRTDHINISVGANETKVSDITYPYNVGIYSGVFIIPSIDNIGDIINIHTLPDTLVGFLTNNVNIGVNTFEVNDITNLVIGFLLSIDDGINKNNMGEIIAIDKVNNIITTSLSTTVAFNYGALIKITIDRIRNIVINKAEDIEMGIKKVDSSGLPAGSIMRIIYQNNSSQDKKYILKLRIQY